jgi:hypothetical protein
MLFAASISVALSFGQVIAGPVIARDYAPPPPAAANVTTCNGKLYTYEKLAGFGKLPSDLRDKFGDTIGQGSAAAFDKNSLKFKNGVYEGIVWGLPDRGWNTEGTQNTQSRIHKFSVTFTPVDATVAKPSSPNVKLTYLDTVLFTAPNGTPLTGLDPTETVNYPEFPPLPLARCKLCAHSPFASVFSCEGISTVLYPTSSAAQESPT